MSPTNTPFGTGDNDFARLRRVAAQTTTLTASPAAAESAPSEQKTAERRIRRIGGDFEQYPHLLAIKPREGYVFHSDYFNVDGGVACILGFFHDDAARETFDPFWGVSRIPSGLDDASVIVFEQVKRMGAKWVDDRTNDSERLGRLDAGEQASGGTTRGRRKVAKIASDIEELTGELANGASYLHVHNRLLVKAPSLEALDAAVDRIRRLYVDRFGTLSIAAYPGEQRQELTALFRMNEKKRGRGQHFTSTEFAGSHSLVTNGLNDPAGEYVGSMLGDVNNSAVLFNVNGYEHHVVVADSTMNPVLGRAHVPDMWGSKISQSALLSNARVVHLVLDGANLDALGPKLAGLTARLDMNSGDINMFEMFGSAEDELSIFPAHQEKIVLMAEQAYESTDSDRSIIRGSLKDRLSEFYTDKGMWTRDAKNNRERLRLVGLDHRHIPRLQDFVTYFETKYLALSNSKARDGEQLHAYNVLRLVFKDLLDNNGDLFNTYTSDEIDGVAQARRVLYDFSKLLRRSKGIAMAQLVNTIGFAVDSLGEGDTVIIHGAEHIDAGVKSYITTQLERLFARGGRVAYLYNDVDLMLADAEFNRFDRADWTVLGPMTDTTVAAYQRRLGQDIPADLERLVTTKGQNQAYLRRGVSNVVFHLDLALGMNPKRKAQRLEAERKSAERLARAGSVPMRSAATETTDESREPRRLAATAQTAIESDTARLVRAR